MFGSGKNIKSMAYVENVASFLRHCLFLGSGLHVYNYVDKPDLSMNELVSLTRSTLFGRDDVGMRLPAFLGRGIGAIFDLLAFLTGRQFSISSIRVKKFMATTQFSSAYEKSGFVPPRSLSDGLRKTLSYEFLEDNASKATFETE